MHPNTTRGYTKARNMHQWADRKGGLKASPDGFDRSEPDTLASLIDDWFHRLEERRYSAHTIEGRKWALRTFLEWSQERSLTNPSEVTKPILEAYQRWLFNYRKVDGNPLAVESQRSRLGALQVFFAWLCRQNVLVANPAADLELPRKTARMLPRSLAPDQVRAVLEMPDTTDPLGVRDRAILETFYATGIRRREMVRLDIDDCDFSRCLLLVRQGKGTKDRMVPLGEHARNWIARYVADVRPLLDAGKAGRALFISGYGERLSHGYLGNWVHRLLLKTGAVRQGSCHLFRHACATHMLENGADIRYIQQLLGHARLDTTQIYTEVSIVQLRKVHAFTHPRGRLDATPDPAPDPKQPAIGASDQTYS